MARAHESHVQLLSLVEKLCSFDSTLNFSFTYELKRLNLINAETLERTDNEVITTSIERDCWYGSLVSITLFLLQGGVVAVATIFIQKMITLQSSINICWRRTFDHW